VQQQPGRVRYPRHLDGDGRNAVLMTHRAAVRSPTEINEPHNLAADMIEPVSARPRPPAFPRSKLGAPVHNQSRWPSDLAVVGQTMQDGTLGRGRCLYYRVGNVGSTNVP
jgi:hypothetical protein